MMKLVCFGLVLLSVCSLAEGQDLARAQGLPLLVSIPTAPVPVRADGKYRLVYELHIVNTADKAIDLFRAEVWSASKLATLETEALRKAIKPTNNNPTPPANRIQPGQHAVIMFWLTLDDVPPFLTHRLEGTVGPDPQPLTLDSSPIDVKGSLIRLSPPLRGRHWIAVEGPSNDTHHRRSWLAFDGRPFAPERFAIDFVRFYDDGKLMKDDPTDNHNWSSYGAEAVAVAEARVASVTDGVPDNKPTNNGGPTPPATIEGITGNSIVLDLGNGHYAFYLHLQPGSLKVKPGDRVKQGQVLGLVGNSGNSNGSHLHFQVTDGPSPLFSDGLPFVIDSFEHETADEFVGDHVRLSTGIIQRRDEIPLQNWVVNFR